MVADNADEGPTSQPPPQPSSPSQLTPPPQLHSGNLSRRRSPRLVECSSSEHVPSNKKAKLTKTRFSGLEFNDGEKAKEKVPCFVGDPVSDDEARRRWPWRYDLEGLKRKGRYPTTKVNSDDDDDELILNVKCHYLQAKISTRLFNIGDCATVKGEEGGHDHVGRILEFFKTNTDEEFFRVQWFFRAEDTVIKDAATSNNKKRVFYSTLMNDNPLDCIVSKVKVLKVTPGINLKSIPKCDFYYDMEYNVNYSTFSTMKDDVSSNNGSPKKEEIHSNGSIGASINGTLTKCKSHKSELTLLDLYSGCGGMSTGLCFGAKLSGVDLSTKWAVDANKCACESLRLNHPETQIRNESAEDFLGLIKEWDKLCKKYKVKEKKTDGHDPMLVGSQDDVTPSKVDNVVRKDEYEKTDGHDTMLARSQDDVTPLKADNIVAQDEYEKTNGHDHVLVGSQDDVTPSKADNIDAKVEYEKTDGHDPMLARSQDDVTPSKADNMVTEDEYEKTNGHDPVLVGSQDDVTPSKADNIDAKVEYEKTDGHDPMLARSQDDVTPSKADNMVAEDEYEKTDGHDPMLVGSQDDVTPSKADNIVAKDEYQKTDGHDPMLAGSQDDVTPSKADNMAAKDEYEKTDGHDPMLAGFQDDVTPSKADNMVAEYEYEKTDGHDPVLVGSQDDVTPSKADNIVAKDEYQKTDCHDPMLAGSQDDVTPSKADNMVAKDEYEKTDGHDPMLAGSQDDVTPSKADNTVAKDKYEKRGGHDPMLEGLEDDVTPSKADNVVAKDEYEKTDCHDPMLAESQEDVTPSKADNIVAKGEYEVEKLVDICYSDLDGTNKRELKFKVRWAGYGPSDDTWEPIQGLRNCQDKIREFVHKGFKAKILPRPGDVDIICGGPPCQGISGHNRHRNFESPLEDERNYQIVVFTEIISFLKPRYVLMENVCDILRFANGCLARYAISCLVREYYQVRLGIMAAGSYGLPQFRLRVFLWGAYHDEHLPPFPLPTHDVVFKYGSPTGFERNVVAYDQGKLHNVEKSVLLKDAISDLPPISNSESRDKMNYTNAPETEFQKFIRATKSDMLGNASLSSHDEKKPLLYDHRPFPLNEDDCLRVSRVPKRKGASFRDLPGIVFGDDNVVSRAPEPELMPSGKHWVPNYAINFNDGKNMKSFARVWWDETVSTVLCTPNYRTEAIMHPEQDRVLTIRECARLQGFPDFYALCGTVSERYRQVGNAVAVPVGRALGYTLGMAVQKLSGDEPLVTLPPKFAHSTTIDLLQPSVAMEP